MAMKLERFNKEYYVKRNIYDAVLNGLSSSLYEYKNGIIYIRVFVNSKWQKNYSETAYEIAHRWKNSFHEFDQAIGCKVFIYDIHKRKDVQSLAEIGCSVDSHAKKGILFSSNQLN